MPRPARAVECPRLSAFLVLLLAVAAPALAGYQYGGYNPEVIYEEHGLANAALYIDKGGLFSSASQGVTDDDIIAPDFSFALPAGTAVRYARLNVSWWGGSEDYTTTLDLRINGSPVEQVSFGGTGDSNPTYEPHATSVYGAGAGMWLTCFDVTDHVALGQTNQVELDLPNWANELFDGRCYHWEIVAAYDAPTDYALSYQIAEGLGTIRNDDVFRPGAPYVTSRTITFSDFDLVEPFNAELWMALTHGTENQLDWAELNGVRLGNTDDLASGSERSAFFDPNVYGNRSYFDFKNFDVTDLLLPTGNALTVETPEVDGEWILNAATMVLAVRGPADVIPEPCTMALLGIGLAALTVRRRRR